MPTIRSSKVDASEFISGLSSPLPSSGSSATSWTHELWGSRQGSSLSYASSDCESPSDDQYRRKSSRNHTARRPSNKYSQIPPKKQIKSKRGWKPTINPVICPTPKTITINGRKLQPTAVFDTFWYFACERKAIDDRRREGLPAPWTADPILDHYFFCNTFRVLDKVTQYLIKDVIEKGPQSRTEVVFRVVLFNMFTKIETWELLQRKLGPLTWKTYNRAKYAAVLGRAKKEGQVLYTGAFIKPAPQFEGSDNHMNHLLQLEVFMDHELPLRLSQAVYLAELYEWLISFPCMGEFTTYQLLLNLSYTRFLNYSSNDFVVAGPGAISGLLKMFGKSFEAAQRDKPDFEVDVMRWLAKHQHEHFARLGLKFSGLSTTYRSMELPDIEHTLCEVDKYSRLAHPAIKGKRTEIRRSYDSSKSASQPKVVLPKAWSHPDRMIARIRPGGRPVKEKRYQISRLGDHRNGRSGREYLVFWHGWSDGEATWEPEEGLFLDAPKALAGYKAKRGLD